MSAKHGKEEIKQWYSKLVPTTDIIRVLDVGAGIGTYSKLLRNKSKFKEFWEAVEIWTPYIEEYHLMDMYNSVHIQDIRLFEWTTKYDLVIFGDVLEHMHKINAEITVEKAMQNSRFILISIPLGINVQGAWGGNPFEVHVKPDWTHKEVLTTWPTAKRIDNFTLNNPDTTIVGVYLLTMKPKNLTIPM